MDPDRREKWEGVLLPLTRLSRFSRRQAAETLRESSPGFVTRLLNEVVDANLLVRKRHRGDDQFQWLCRDPEPLVRDWIEQRIHGDQVKQMPVAERPRERLMADGAETLSTAELMAILIRVGVRGESATTGGRKLANAMAGRLADLRRAGHAELKLISKAITKAGYCQLMAGIELGRRVARDETIQQDQHLRITSTADALAYCRGRFAHLAGDAVQEEFHIVTLDVKHKPLQSHRITVGTLDASLVHPREVFRPAIRDAAAGVLLVHNHPSGDPTPSREDHQVTGRLTEAGELIGISVLDHIIVARERCVSLREEA